VFFGGGVCNGLIFNKIFVVFLEGMGLGLVFLDCGRSKGAHKRWGNKPHLWDFYAALVGGMGLW